MRILLTLFMLLMSANVLSSVCSSIASCKSCVSVKSTDLSFSGDSSCFSSLSSRNESGQTFRFASTIDQYSISYSLQMNRAETGLTSIAAAVNRAYQDHEMRQKVGAFYNQLPQMLDNHHQRLMNYISENKRLRAEAYPAKLHSFEKEISFIKNNLPPMTSLDVNTTSASDMTEDYGYRNHYQKIKEDIADDEFLRSFPNLTGKHEDNLLARESSRNAAIADTETRAQHNKMLEGAKKFKAKGSNELSEELIAEAKHLRRGGVLPEKSLSSRVESFELNQSLIKDKKLLLKRKYEESDAQGWEKDRLDIASDLGRILEQSATESFFSGNLQAGEGWNKSALEVLDLALGFIPGVSLGKDILEAVTGKNWVTGDTLNVYERGLAVMGVMTLGTGSMVKNSVSVLNKATDLLVASKKLAPESRLSKTLVNSNVKLFAGIKDGVWRKGDELNEAFRLQENIPLEKFIDPWQKGRRVLEFTTTSDIQLYRVFSDNLSAKPFDKVAEATGQWLTSIDPNSIDKLNLRNILHIPQTNKMESFAIVKIPAGKRIQLGVVGRSADGQKGGGTQFYLVDQKVDASWIVETRAYKD